MASASGQPQFRYTQPPSKVLHLRNLPWECTEEELIELGKPFGKVINTKCNVGANRNQAFIEFAELNQAIAMISYYASSSEPAQVRGKTVYLQYSNRQEIVHNKTIGDLASNVLLVTVEGVEAGDVSIDVLHLVFSAFGFVHKVATFEKTAGFQALIQFSDSETATAAKTSLEGRSIPRYLLQEHVGPCSLKINFSAHTDLNVKFQSHRSRDYTNPYLPVAPSAIDGSGQFSVGPDGKKQEPESNVLLASMENMQYAVTADTLRTVFSAFGPVQKIAIFEKNGGFQALIQYPDVHTAVAAKEALEGHCIYDGGYCKLHLSYSRHTDLNVKVNSDRSRDYTIPNSAMLNSQPSILGQQPVPMLNAITPQISSNSFAPVPDGIMGPRPGGGWDVGAEVNAPVPVQLPNQMYGPPGTTPREMGVLAIENYRGGFENSMQQGGGALPLPGHDGQMHVSSMPPQFVGHGGQMHVSSIPSQLPVHGGQMHISLVPRQLPQNHGGEMHVTPMSPQWPGHGGSSMPHQLPGHGGQMQISSMPHQLPGHGGQMHISMPHQLPGHGGQTHISSMHPYGF